MTQTFERAFDRLIGHEGGYVNDPADRGGATNWGISLRWYKANVNENATWRTIRDLTRDDAKRLYHTHFWKAPIANLLPRGYEQLPPWVAELMFNFGVNFGNKDAHFFLQKSLHEQGIYNSKVDGVLGSNTLDGVARANQRYLIEDIVKFALLEYHTLAVKGYGKRFIKGWFERAVKALLESYDILIQRN